MHVASTALYIGVTVCFGEMHYVFVDLWNEALNNYSIISTDFVLHATVGERPDPASLNPTNDEAEVYVDCTV